MENENLEDERQDGLVILRRIFVEMGCVGAM
jgi:hypothetical protein